VLLRAAIHDARCLRDNASMSRPFRNATAVLILLVSLAGFGCKPSASAILGDCNDRTIDPAILIAACSHAIEAGGLDKAAFSAAYTGRARGYFQQRKFEPGLADLDTLIRQQPDNVLAFRYRGSAYSMQGDTDRALSDAHEEMRLAPNDALSYVDLGQVYAEKNDYDHAIENLNRAIELQPENAFALNGRCWARAITGRELDEALSDCEHSLRIFPHDANSLNSRGFVHFRKQQYGAAISDYNESIAYYDKLGSSFYIRGLAKLAVGDTTGADDIAHGKQIEPGVDARYARYGIPAAR
jgi:tetratricopeptide (TPR) repeat protein